MSFHLIITTPDSAVFDRTVESIVVPGLKGSLGVLSRHAPLVTVMGPGIIRIEESGGSSLMVTSGGVLEATPKEVCILADSVVAAANAADAESKIEELRAAQRADQARQR